MFLFFINFSFSLKNREINESLTKMGFDAIDSYYEATNSHKTSPVILSMRWSNLEKQFHHFIFGASIAFALNRTLQVEMLKYPVTNPQPEPYFDFSPFDKPGDYMSEKYARLRIDMYFPCKTKDQITKYDETRPILIRNYDIVTSLYSSHFLNPILYKNFEYRAAYFFARKYLLKNTQHLEEVYKDFIGVEISTYFIREKELKTVDHIFSIFQKYLNQLYDKKTTKYVFVTYNNTLFSKLIKKEYPSAIILDPDYDGFSILCSCKTVVGTYRSDFTAAVSLSRDTPGYLIDYVTDNLITQSTSLSGIISPFNSKFDVLPNMVNMKLKGCKDNEDELQQVLNTFVL